MKNCKLGNTNQIHKTVNQNQSQPINSINNEGRITHQEYLEEDEIVEAENVFLLR